MPLRIGETFAGYRILRPLGAGGMGEVYLVQHPRLPRRDALKVLRPDVSDDASFRERFIREADMAAGLRHPNIVAIHDRGEHAGRLWITMDYIDGTDAARLIEQQYPEGLPVELVARLVTAVASALDHAHKKGLVHRDVKPANIIVGDIDTTEPSVFLTDFGIARPLDDTSGITTTNMTVGTVAYAAPEQLLGEPLDGRTDQYALAATTYHLLTGSQLFPNSNPAVVIGRHLNTAPPRLGDSRPELARVDPALQSALAKEPDDRYPSCSAFAHALGVDLSGQPAISPSAATRRAPRTRRSSHSGGLPAPVALAGASGEGRSRRARVATAAISAVFLAGIAGLTWHLLDTRRSATESPVEIPTSVAAVPESAAPLPPSPSTAAPRRSPSAPPPLSPTDIDQILLTGDQLTRLLGTTISDDPKGRGGIGLGLESSLYGTTDHADQVTPRSCVGVVFTGEHDVYSASDAEQIKTQTFGSLYRGSPGQPHLLQQTAAVFPTAGQAQSFLTRTQAQWTTCARSDVDANLGFENGARYALSAVGQAEGSIAVAMATSSGLNGPDACQQAMGVRRNVVVEVRTCEVPDDQVSYDPTNGSKRDPGWAVPDAERVVNATLENVQP